MKKKKKQKKDTKVVPAIACKFACECRRLSPLVAAFKTSRETSQTAMNQKKWPYSQAICKSAKTSLIK